MVKSGKGEVIVDLSLLVSLCSFVAGVLLYATGFSAWVVGLMLMAAISASVFMRSCSLALPIKVPASDMTARCPHCDFIITTPRSISILNCPDCMNWVRVLGARFFKVNEDEALRFAAAGGQTETVKTLLNNGAQVDATDQAGNTALKEAASSGYIGIVKTLLDAGADVDSRGGDGSTPLMYAAGSGYPETVKALLVAGADVRARNKAGLTPLKIAADRRHHDIVGLLREAGARQ